MTGQCFMTYRTNSQSILNALTMPSVVAENIFSPDIWSDIIAPGWVFSSA